MLNVYTLHLCDGPIYSYFFKLPAIEFTKTSYRAEIENTQIGEQIVTSSNWLKSISFFSNGIPQRCIPNLLHHQKSKIPSTFSVVFNSYNTAPVLLASSKAMFLVYPILEKQTTIFLRLVPILLYFE